VLLRDIAKFQEQIEAQLREQALLKEELEQAKQNAARYSPT
jgi:hypothetical protein